MFNQSKIDRLKKVAIAFGLVFLLIISFSVGNTIGKKQQKATQKPVKQETVKKEDNLTSATVKEFLIAQYTRKDLGENRNRYKPLVTTAMYNEMVTDEEQPVNQAYKGYVVNQVLDSADIYIDTENSSAICSVVYKNTQRTKIGTDEGALKNQTNREAIQLTFSKTGKKYLVDKIEPVTLTNLLTTDNNSYNTTVTTGSEESEEEPIEDSSTTAEKKSTEESSHEQN